MLQFSAKGEYAVLAILSLSLHSDRNPLQVKAIARNEDISVRFLEQVMSLLKRKGLVESVRGAHGGYLLTRSPDQISLAEVLQAVEGPIAVGDSTVGNHGKLGASRLVLREVWSEMNESLKAQLHAISFETLGERKREKEEREVPMFHI